MKKDFKKKSLFGVGLGRGILGIPKSVPEWRSENLSRSKCKVGIIRKGMYMKLWHDPGINR